MGDLFSLGFRVGMLTLGPVLVVIATCLISFCLYVGTTSVLPLYGAGLIYYASTIFTIFLGINILFNYTLCVFTNPGTHDSKPFLQLVEMARENEDLKLFHRKPANDRSFCSNSEGIELRKRVDKAEATDSPKYGSKTINAEDVSFFDSEDEDDDPFGWEEAEDRVDDGEWDQIDYDKTEHRHDRREVFENPQEEERFSHSEEQDDRHGGFALSGKWIIYRVEHHLGDTGKHVNEVDEVPKVRKIGTCPNSDYLTDVICDWVDCTDEE